MFNIKQILQGAKHIPYTHRYFLKHKDLRSSSRQNAIAHSLANAFPEILDAQEQSAVILVVLGAGEKILQLLDGSQAIAVLGESGILAQEVGAVDRIALVPGRPVLCLASIPDVFLMAHLAVIGTQLALLLHTPHFPHEGSLLFVERAIHEVTDLALATCRWTRWTDFLGLILANFLNPLHFLFLGRIL